MILDNIVILNRAGILSTQWRGISSAGRCLYITMYAICDTDGSIKATHKELSYECGISSRKVSRVISELKTVGLISKNQGRYYIESRIDDIVIS